MFYFTPPSTVPHQPSTVYRPPSTVKTCLRVGITGNIGSGKSTVCRIFETLGIPVYDTDYWAKWLIVHDPALVKGIRNLFGEAAYLPDGAYNRAYVSGIVFEQKDKLAALNTLVHPAVAAHSLAWHEQKAQEGCPYTLRESALLFEAGFHLQMDLTIVVTAPQNVRIQRIMLRDQLSEQAVMARIQSQMPEEEKRKLANFVVENDGVHALIPQVMNIHRKILSHSF